jgi:hypothetical protein
MRKYTVVMEWSETGGESDADEVAVFADSAAEAVVKARSRWRVTIGAEWPHCRLIRAWVLTPQKSKSFP